MKADHNAVIECKSRDGITIGLIDALITTAAVLHQRLLQDHRRGRKNSQPVIDALDDLRLNKNFRELVFPGGDEAMRIIDRAAEAIRARNTTD
jgi:hypothetical protein